VALDDVLRGRREWFDETFPHTGRDMFKPEFLRDAEVVKRLTIDEKIAFWQAVMQLAKDRGIDVYWFTWNLFLYGAEGKHDLTRSRPDDNRVNYFRASVRETVKTYPLLAGMGITAGEHMNNELTENVAADLEIARGWSPGSVSPPPIRRLNLRLYGD
jgi:hypothetical protein